MAADNLELRSLPAVNTLLGHPLLEAARARLDDTFVVELVRETLAEERARRLAGQASRELGRLAELVAERLTALTQPSLVPVLNATGVVLNTNMGRAPLAAAALAAIAATAGGYSNLELDLKSGQRGDRTAHVAALLCRLTGAEAALVVNNCAAAVLLIVDTLARGRAAVVSRGQLIEIGGSFRLPDVIAASGAKLVEVGTTNKTYLEDYARAVGPETGLLLLSHTSNYRVVGFTASVDRQALATLGRERGVPTVEDLGSGLLLELAGWGLPPEPTVQASVAAGIDLVAFSGDKLLGGPQCGLIVGRQELIQRLARNPLNRALRPDKLALAALAATLGLYLEPAVASAQVPTLRMLAYAPAALAARAEALARALAADERLEVELGPGVSAVGGGTLPGVELPTTLVRLRARALGIDELARRLRAGSPALVGRIASDRLLLDPRTLAEDDDARVVTALREALR